MIWQIIGAMVGLMTAQTTVILTLILPRLGAIEHRMDRLEDKLDLHLREDHGITHA